jgi:cytochrome c
MYKRTVLAAALAAGLLAVPVAQADEAMAKKYNCTACHQLDKKVVGPAYKEVAQKYRRGHPEAGGLDPRDVTARPLPK